VGNVVGNPTVLQTQKKTSRDDVGDVVDTIQTYAKQETLGPLKGVGRAVGFGIAGVLCLGIGIIVLLIALLRVLQTETSVFEDDWSWVPYVITFAVAAVIIAITLSRIRKLEFERGESRQ
jgi:hypothetical protein